MTLPDTHTLLVLAMVYGAIIAFLLAAFLITAIWFGLLGFIITPRRPKPEIVKDGLIIFDVS